MYNRNLRLKENQIAASIDLETGEVKPLPIADSLKEHIEVNRMIPFKLMDKFTRFHSAGWATLRTQATPKQYAVAFKLAIRAKAYTNSLEPINPDMTATLLAEELKESRRYIKKAIDRLFELGVIGKFEVYEAGENHRKYWVFNPYLAFNGKTIKKDVITLFDNTLYARLV